MGNPGTIIPMMDCNASCRDSARLLNLCRLVSPALPIGAYAFSHGLETAVHAGWVDDEDSASRWILGVLEHTLTALDIPVLERLYRAWENGDQASVIHWSCFLLACRESRELREEDQHLGIALARLLRQIGVCSADFGVDSDSTSYATFFALASVYWDIRMDEAAAGYLWSWVENQVTAAIKLVPLGQSAGQRILCQAITCIPPAAARGLGVQDQRIGATAPGLAITSALHETQYTRLFRS